MVTRPMRKSRSKRLVYAGEANELLQTQQKLAGCYILFIAQWRPFLPVGKSHQWRNFPLRGRAPSSACHLTVSFTPTTSRFKPISSILPSSIVPIMKRFDVDNGRVEGNGVGYVTSSYPISWQNGWNSPGNLVYTCQSGLEPWKCRPRAITPDM